MPIREPGKERHLKLKAVKIIVGFAGVFHVFGLRPQVHKAADAGCPEQLVHFQHLLVELLSRFNLQQLFALRGYGILGQQGRNRAQLGHKICVDLLRALTVKQKVEIQPAIFDLPLGIHQLCFDIFNFGLRTKHVGGQPFAVGQQRLVDTLALLRPRECALVNHNTFAGAQVIEVGHFDVANQFPLVHLNFVFLQQHLLPPDLLVVNQIRIQQRHGRSRTDIVKVARKKVCVDVFNTRKLVGSRELVQRGVHGVHDIAYGKADASAAFTAGEVAQ